MGKRKGYGRVSSRGQQRDGNSLEDQKKKLREAGCAEAGSAGEELATSEEFFKSY